MNILSIQSHVSYGYVGNSAAVFTLQRLGLTVWPIHTVAFSNHTGYGDWTGQVFNVDHIKDLIEGLAARDAFRRCDAVLSGYIGAPELGEVVLETVRRVRAANPQALFACDPVMGDFDTGLYVNEGIPDFFKEEAAAKANILTPNHFELEILAGGKISTLAGAIAAARQLLNWAATQDTGEQVTGEGQQPKIVLITSFQHDQTPAGEIEMVAVTADRAWRLVTPFVPLSPAPNGSGDTVCALFLAHYLSHGDPCRALSQAGSAIYSVMSATGAAGSRELQLIEAQDRLADPEVSFNAELVEE